MLVKQNSVSQRKTTMWFHIIENLCVVHDKHDRANRSDIAYTSNQPGDSRDVSRCIICDCTYCTSDCYIVYWLCFQNLEMGNMTGGCLESFTPVNKNFASPKLCTQEHHYS